MQDSAPAPKSEEVDATPTASVSKAAPNKGARTRGSSTPRRKSASRGKIRKSNGPSDSARKRLPRPYPASPFEDALALAKAIQQFASGQKVRRLTLLKQLDKSPTSSSTRMLIVSSSRYGITVGGYDAEWLDITELGSIASSPDSAPREKREAQFKLAIERIAPFFRLYSEYKGKKLPTHDVLKDVLVEAKFEIEDLKECVDLFIVNSKFLGLLQTIAGSETLISIEQVLDELETRRSTAQDGRETHFSHSFGPKLEAQDLRTERSTSNEQAPQKVDWSRTCFVITPIGDDASETRRHSDLFLSALIEPALREFGMNVIRADKIGTAGMITSQILEYVMRSRLAIADLSFHNPNAFYEMAIRHACGLPIVQISRKADKLPFDVNQVRTVVIDTTDIYTLVPKLETYRSEIATQVRAALSDAGTPSNPISVFFPGIEVIIPKEK